MSETTDAVQAQLADLKRTYGRELPGKISRIEAMLRPVFAGPWEQQSCSAAYRQIHSLAGSSGTYGFPEICGLARSAEVLLKQCLDSLALLAEPEQRQVETLMATLREMAADTARQFSS